MRSEKPNEPDKVPVTFFISREEHRQVKARAALDGIPLREFVLQAVKEKVGKVRK